MGSIGSSNNRKFSSDGHDPTTGASTTGECESKDKDPQRNKDETKTRHLKVDGLTAERGVRKAPQDADACTDQSQPLKDDDDRGDMHWLRAWAWKREHRPDKARFHRPYLYPLNSMAPFLEGKESERKVPGEKLSIEQAPFNAEGFASTVWDSSIVASKYLERYPFLVKGRKCLDLSAGCGLVAVVMGSLQQRQLLATDGHSHVTTKEGTAEENEEANDEGSAVVATDLASNLRLLERNCAQIGERSRLFLRMCGLLARMAEVADIPQDIEPRFREHEFPIAVKEYTWGQNPSHLGGPFDLLVACDVMYIEESSSALVQSLAQLVKRPSQCADTPGGTALIAYGRNRSAETSFRSYAHSAGFNIREIASGSMDPVYHCVDVTVLELVWATSDAECGRMCKKHT